MLGGIFESEGDYQSAARFYDRALSITQKNSGQQSLAFADCQHRLGRATFKAGLPPGKAEEMYRSSLSVIMIQPDLSCGDLLNELLSDYIDLFRKADDQGKALSSDFQNELLKDRLGTLERTEGVAASMWNKEVSAKLAGQGNDGAIFPPGFSDSPVKLPVIEPNKPLSNYLSLDQINRQRVDFYERMIEIDIKSLGPDHPAVARDLNALASIYLLQKKYDEAKPLLLKAWKIYSSVYGSDALLLRRTQTLLSLVAQEQNPSAGESVSESELVSALPQIPLAAQKLEIALKLNYLALLCYSHGRIKDASTVYAWALACTTLACGDDSTLAACCLSDYSRVLANLGKQDEALKMEGRAHLILRRALAKQAAQSMP